MTATTHTLPPLLVAIAEYAADQPDLDQLERALHAASDILRMRVQDSSLPREEARQQFIQHEGEDNDIRLADAELMTAAQVSFGDPAFLYGLACCWLLLHGKDGAR